MHQTNWAESALDYRMCRYGSSRLLFRGPKKTWREPYISFLGGTETYGKFVTSPYPDLVGSEMGLPRINLGSHNAGLDAFLNDETSVSICNRGKMTVLQAFSAANLSNRYYAVHPRRNDRFLQASPMLERAFPDMDFMEFNFTRHLLAKLKISSPTEYANVVQALRETWVVRTNQLLRRLGGRVVLLWIGEVGDTSHPADAEPFLVTKRMIERVQSNCLDCVKVSFRQETRALGTDGMHFLEHEQEAAKRLPGPVAHQDIARALVPVLKRQLAQKKTAR